MMLKIETTTTTTYKSITDIMAFNIDVNSIDY
jgi:hypothetical protein